MTCDSDGEVDRFVDMRDVKDALELHALDGKPYYVAILLIGAYQDVLGDYHNLFGIVDEAHIVVGSGKRGSKVAHDPAGRPRARTCSASSPTTPTT